VNASSCLLVVPLLFALAAPAALAAPHVRAQAVHPEDWRFMRTVAEIGHRKRSPESSP
jgi:hypothetical protein